MRSRLFFLFALAALLFVAGCERSDVSSFTVESDEPGYRRGKDLIKQGRNQEALNEFLKLLDKRGLSNSPETNLELGLIYQYHIKDPTAAIFHYKKFRELKPNSPQSDLVRQRIDAASRDFGRMLPGQPLENQLDQLDQSDQLQRLLRENDKLKADLAALRAGKTPAPDAEATTPAPDAEHAQAPEPAPARTVETANNDASPVMRAPVESESTPAPTAPTPVAPVRPPPTQPARPAANATTTTRPPTTPPTTTRPAPTTGSYRRHIVVKGDTLTSLALKYYGDRSRLHDIYAANRGVMKNEGDLRIGMELKIPQ